MKSIVVYYSATGNTRRIARAVYRGMKDLLGDCDIAPVSKIDPRDMAKYDLVGIGAPIWYFRAPANVMSFIYNMPDMEGKLCFPFCVHGAAPAGFMFSIAPQLKRKSLTIIGYNDWFGGVEQVLHMPKPYLTDGHPDEIDLREAEDFGREMAERARRIYAGERQLIPELPRGPEADPLWRPNPFREIPPPDARPMRTIDRKKCNYPDCTLCADICPMKAVDLSADPPLFRQSCINCSLCDKLCPANAVKVDEEVLRTRSCRVIDMEKCAYPKCTLCLDHCPMHSIDFSANPPVFKWNCECDDLCWVICPEGAIEITNPDDSHRPKAILDPEHPFVKVLEEAETAGRFRRLVPLDKVGWDNIILDNPTHPRFVIEED